MSGESLSREDYCERCGRTYTARFDATRHVFEIGCRRCDPSPREQLALYTLTDMEPSVREHWMARLTRLGVAVEELPAMSEGVY